MQTVGRAVRLGLAAKQDRAVAFAALGPPAMMFFQLQQGKAEKRAALLLQFYGFGFFRHGSRRQMAFLVVDLLDAVAGVGFLVAGITAEMQSVAVGYSDRGIAGNRLMGDFSQMLGGAARRPMIRYAAAQFPK